MNEPAVKLSIITPVRNGERFIKGCLASVIQQECANLEHIIIDGGSTDATGTIAGQYAKDYPHVRFIADPDEGLSEALNKGLDLAQGRYVTILGCDDFYEPHVLNEVIALLDSLPEPALLIGNCNVLDQNDDVLYVNRPRKLTLFDLLSGAPHPVNPSAYFYHKSLHALIGNYDICEKYAMDLDFLIRAVQVAHVKYINRTLGNYRLHENSITGQSMAKGGVARNTQRIRDKHYAPLSIKDKLCFFVYKYSKKAVYKIRCSLGLLREEP